MKSKRRPTGPGDLAIDQFVRTIVGLEGGAVVAEKEFFRIELDGGRRSVLVKRDPTNRDEWSTRFEWIEKQAAIVLNNPPLMYSMVRSAGTKKRDSAMMQLSIGLSLSIGDPLARRYAVTFVRGARGATVEEGGSLPSDVGAKTIVLTSLPSWAKQSLKKMSTGVLDACDQFQTRPEVRNAIERIGEKRRTELAYLEHLYARRHESDGRLYGLAEEDTQGSASIEAECRRLQGVALERYTAAIRLRILSIGLLEGYISRSGLAR